MDALRDQSWMPYLFMSSPAERFDRGRFSVVSVTAAPTSAHHNDRYRYRLFFFQKNLRAPVMSVDMESDLLGGWRLSVTTASESRIAAQFDEPPGYEAFKAMALAVADRELSETSLKTRHGRPARGKRLKRDGPTYP